MSGMELVIVVGIVAIAVLVASKWHPNYPK